MRNYKLPRTGDEPLTFRGELIVGQDFIDEQDAYLDAQGELRFGKYRCKMSFNFFKTDDGRFVYQGFLRTTPQCGRDSSVVKFLTAKEHRAAVKTLDAMNKVPGIKAGPLRLPTT
jgi:hypothetical protein